MPSDSFGDIQVLLNSLAVLPGVRWYHISDPSSHALDHLAEHFGIHPLQVEDCRHRWQTARLEEHEKYTFMVIKEIAGGMADRRPGQRSATPSGAQPAREGLNSSQDSSRSGPHEASSPGVGGLKFEDFDIFLGADYVLTVSNGESLLVSSVVARVTGVPALRDPGRITHALVDSAVDCYLPALDSLGDFINRLEDRVIRNPAPATLREIFRLKRTLLDFRRVATAMREAVNGLVRRYDTLHLSDASSAQSELRFYYRDVYDHVVRVVDFIETYRDLLTGSLDIYLSAVANRTNEVMKILTLWGTIAMPLLVITSFYGMNIKLPLEHDPHALIPVGLLMVASTIAVVVYIRRKHWL
jgi:magnesium transporter